MFETLSDGQFIFISAVMIATIFAAIRLYSFIGMTMWAFTAITLVGVLEFNLSIVYFWFMVILTAISLSLGMGVRVRYGSNV